MKDRLAMFAGLLAAQVLLIGGLSLAGSRTPESSNFLDLEPDTITEIVIADADGESVRLEKSADRWRLEGGVEADQAKISEVLEKFAGIGSLWPVATTASSRERFEVSQDSFQRHIQMRAGDEDVADFYLGTSPGYRRVHARSAAADDILSIEFANYEVPTDLDEWLDKTLLQSAGVSRIELEDGWTLDNAQGSWHLDGVEADEDAATQLVDRVAGLRLLGFYEGDESALADEHRLQITDEEGSHALTLRHDEENDEYVVSSERVPGLFTIASYVAEQIVVEAQELMPEVEAEPPVPAATDDVTPDPAEGSVDNG